MVLLGRQVREELIEGQVVSDELLVELIFEEIRHLPSGVGLLFDGFPATRCQADLLENRLTIGRIEDEHLRSVQGSADDMVTGCQSSSCLEDSLVKSDSPAAQKDDNSQASFNEVQGQTAQTSIPPAPFRSSSPSGQASNGTADQTTESMVIHTASAVERRIGLDLVVCLDVSDDTAIYRASKLKPAVDETAFDDQVDTFEGSTAFSGSKELAEGTSLLLARLSHFHTAWPSLAKLYAAVDQPSRMVLLDGEVKVPTTHSASAKPLSEADVCELTDAFIDQLSTKVKETIQQFLTLRQEQRDLEARLAYEAEQTASLDRANAEAEMQISEVISRSSSSQEKGAEGQPHEDQPPAVAMAEAEKAQTGGPRSAGKSRLPPNSKSPKAGETSATKLAHAGRAKELTAQVHYDALIFAVTLSLLRGFFVVNRLRDVVKLALLPFVWHIYPSCRAVSSHCILSQPKCLPGQV
ncbi:unnamed protein product [Protopolystoma xenopodis]|uniref:Adenylate kinase n=1 Tax=Protopolystoma xenopodis TaxID=117903 RepID=A0A448WA84_9PLAT|nr:unnamed protein product [Protopolystoma xenopodis]